MTHSTNSVWNQHEGYVMRSYAEARVAEVMTRIGFAWVYEHMPYNFRGYLPDFYLPNLDAFVEVKGVDASDEELEKCERLHNETGCPVVLSEGSPAEPGWRPRLYLDGRWRTIPMMTIREGVNRFASPEEAIRFRAAFDVSHIGSRGPALISAFCDAFRVSIHHEMDSKSRAIYEHNEPVTQERLQSLDGKMSPAERHCHDFLAPRRIGGNA
ncbi:hypothetical protein [Modicisalibacter coralii]|uniref:hypothetical protein n=1 Tax=Modicisalibacter coralii TaxID=2304602 RepID=UPI00100BC278|nr:hypothetical protein [Halomonas coralii]